MMFDIKEDGKFKYFEAGEGEELILLHGLFGALSNFEGLIDHFKDRYHVVVPMLPIYDLPVLKTNVKNIAKYLNEFINHKEYNQFTLLGNSLGGHVGLVYTLEHQDKVKRLLLTGSSGLYENAFGGGFPKRDSKEFLRERIAVTFYDQKFVTDELVDECHEAVNNREKVIRIITIAKSAIRHNMSKHLSEYKIPVGLIWGKQDQITPPEVAEEFHEGIPNSTLYWIDKCGHAPMMEHPELFNEYLDDWLAKTNN